MVSCPSCGSGAIAQVAVFTAVKRWCNSCGHEEVEKVGEILR